MKVSIIPIHALVDAIEQHGASSAELLQAAGISRSMLVDSDGWIDVEKYDRLIDLSVRRTGDHAFGIHWGEHSTDSKWDILGALTANAPTLRAAVEALIRFDYLVAESPELSLEESSDQALLRFRITGLTEGSRRVLTELALVGLLRLLQHFSGRDGTPQRVYLDYPSPEHAAEYTRVFGGTELFNHSFTGIEFDQALLDRVAIRASCRALR